jgi:hypothetical protein
MGKDDFAMIIALLFTLGYLVTIYVLRDNKMGFRLSEVSLEQAVTSLKVTYAIESIYYVCVNTIKVSIVFFYLRIGTTLPFSFFLYDCLMGEQPSKNPSNALAKPQSHSSSPSAPYASSSYSRNAGHCTRCGISRNQCRAIVSTPPYSFTVRPSLSLTYTHISCKENGG